MSGGVTDVFRVALMLFCAFVFGKGVEKIGCPALIGEIICGIVLGGEVGEVIPIEDAVNVLGQVGVLMLVLEGGLSIELSTMKALGLRSAATATVGLSLPCAIGFGVLYSFPDFTAKEALVAGVAIAPTSIGMAASIMKDCGLLEDRFGQLVCCSAMFDDTVSLVLLAIIGGMSAEEGEDHETGWGPTKGGLSIAIPIITSIAFLVVTATFAFLVPRILALIKQLPYIKTFDDETWMQLVVFLMAGNATGLTMLAYYARSTFLLGAFMGGVCFSSVPEAREGFHKYVSDISAWMARVFFVSVGLAVPVNALFDAKALAFGALLSVIAVVFKLITGIFDWPNKVALGWAMCGRGELGFLMAKDSKDDDLVSQLAFCTTIWALLVSTFMAPIVLRWWLARLRAQGKMMGSQPAESQAGAVTDQAPKGTAGEEAAEGTAPVAPDSQVVVM